MNRSKRYFTEGAFLFSTFVEFNKCWRSGKKSRLVIESNVNGFAFFNFSAFFAEPTPENLSADSNFANTNVDGNATIFTECVSQTDPADLSESNSSDHQGKRNPIKR